MDNAIRQNVSELQKMGVENLNLWELDKLVDGLISIEAKLVHQKKILAMALEKAMSEQHIRMAARFLTALDMVSSIIEV